MSLLLHKILQAEQ